MSYDYQDGGWQQDGSWTADLELVGMTMHPVVFALALSIGIVAAVNREWRMAKVAGAVLGVGTAGWIVVGIVWMTVVVAARWLS